MIKNNNETEQEIVQYDILNTSTTPYIISKQFVVNKLIKTLNYQYEIELDGNPGNWPVVVVPRSGEFIAQSKSKQVDAVIIFCPNTGVCNSGNNDVLPYNLDYSCGLQNKDLLFTNLRLKVNEKNTTDYIYSDTHLIECAECLKVTKIDVSGFSMKTNQPSSFMMDKNTENVIKIKTEFSDLVPGQEYYWSYNCTSSNWPTVISPPSGSFISAKDTYSIDSVFTFCSDETLCTGLNGYFNYTSTNISNDYKFANINLTINNDEHCYFNESIHTINLYCDDCIPSPEVKFDTNPIALSVPCTDISIALTGLQAHTTYTYNFESYRSNWPTIISPISGTFRTLSNHSIDLPFKLSFCGSEVLCSGDANLMNYDINYNKMYTNTDCDKFSFILFNLYLASDSDNNLLSNNLLKVYCNNCLDFTNIPNITNNS